MANNRRKAKRSKLNSRRVALDWLELGIQPVPLKPRSKAPHSRKGWNTLRVTAETIPEFFNDGDNVGGLWGEPSRWIIDVDLDWDEASEVAYYLLPDTFKYGRLSRPRSHFLYRCEGISGSKRDLRSGEVIAEIRSTGSQSVLPPSMHPDNERYEINHDVDFKNIPRIELERYLSEVAAAAVFVRYFPEDGSRHDYIHAMTGALMWSGWNEKRTRNFLDAVISVTAEYDDDTRQRERTVNNTIQHFKEGDRIAGWKTLSAWLDGPIIQRLRQWLTPKVKYEAAPEADTAPSLIVIPSFDKELIKVPGLVGELIDWSADQSYLRQPAFDLATALMCTAFVTENKYLVQGWHTPLQPYFMLLAPTAGGKNAALSNVYAFAKKMGLGDYVVQNFQSYYALLDQLAAGSMVCWTWDEAARHLAAARSPAGPDFSTLSHLIGLYGRANDDVPASPGRKQNIPPLERPFLTLLAAAQPSQLINAVSVANIATGFVNRLVLFDAGDEAASAHYERTGIFPSALKRQASVITKHQPVKNITVVKFESTEAYVHFVDFDTTSRSMAARGEDLEIWGRANQNALVLAGIVAVGVNPKRPRITPGIADWATALVRWSIGCWTSRIGETSAINYRERDSKGVEKIIREARKYVNRAKSSKYKDEMKNNRMPRAVLQRITRYLDRRQLDDILTQLIEADLIGATENEGGGVTYWPKR